MIIDEDKMKQQRENKHNGIEHRNLIRSNKNAIVDVKSNGTAVIWNSGVPNIGENGIETFDRLNITDHI